MAENVILEEGSSVNVHTRIKDMCKAARNRLGLTNQEICNRISEQFGIDDFSVNTVNNFFSERSKATTIYTTGYICAVLGISIDAVFGIENELTTDEEVEFVRQLSELKYEARIKDQRIDYLEHAVAEKDDRIKQAHTALEHYRDEAKKYSRKVQPWVFVSILVLLICSLLFIAFYLFYFDLGNPDYGIFTASRRVAESPDSIIGQLASIPTFLRQII